MERYVAAVKDLSFTYFGAAEPALEGINLQLRPGEFIILTGPSGCGKSTLALCLTGFIPHGYTGLMEGSVEIKGLNTRENTPGRLAGIVGLVQQDPEMQLCTLRVMDEVAFGPENLGLDPAEIAARVRWALSAVGALELAERDLYTLSGGEKQKVAIASVLAMRPSLLILDEPTANLDPRCTEEVLAVMEKLRRDEEITVIVIEHRLEKLLPLADRALYMERGRIVGEFRGEELAAKAAQDKLFYRQIESAEKRRDNAPALPPRLQVEGLAAGYETPLLKDVSFSLYPGEIAAVMGDNGSGKSTLLHALLGLLKIFRGKIYLDGVDITTEKVSQRAGRIGLSFQNPNHQLFESTVFREAELPSIFLKGCRPGENSRVLRLLEQFDLLAYREQLPFALSLGEKKRLALVSLLAYIPPVLALDEPLVGQDPQRSDLLLGALEEHRARGGVVLMVCHDPAVASAWCGRVLFLEQGELIIDAPTEEAFALLAARGLTHYLPGNGRGLVTGEG